MRPDPSIHAASTADTLSDPQKRCLLLLERTQGVRQFGSGIQWNTFASLGKQGLAVERDGQWYLTERGEPVRKVLVDRGGFGALKDLEKW